MRNPLSEVIDERTGRRSTIVASQLPIHEWHATMADPSAADAILDRLVDSAHKISLRGESLRKEQAQHTSGQAGQKRGGYPVRMCRLELAQPNHQKPPRLKATSIVTRSAHWRTHHGAINHAPIYAQTTSRREIKRVQTRTKPSTVCQWKEPASLRSEGGRFETGNPGLFAPDLVDGFL